MAKACSWSINLFAIEQLSQVTSCQDRPTISLPKQQLKQHFIDSIAYTLKAFSIFFREKFRIEYTL